MTPIDVSWMAGRTVKVTTENGHQWFFDLGDSIRIGVECPWRIFLKKNIRLTSEDHNVKYGLPAPIDAAAEANKLLIRSTVVSAEVRHGTPDLLLSFQGDLRLEIIPVFTGYEAWHIWKQQDELAFAGPGGEVSRR